jgi:uncharacterized protein (TIGR02596 family)
MNTNQFPSFRKRAFSLIEILAVVAILGILMAFVAPAIISSLGASNLNKAGQTIGDQIALARQEALTRNREVQIRFYYISNGQDAGWRAIQIWRVESSDDKFTDIAVSRLQRLPEGITISGDPSLSPLLKADQSVQGESNLPGGIASYSGFRFLPGGGTGDALTTANNFVTVQSSLETRNPPKNFYTVQVHPLTGKVSVFRP